MPSEVKMSLDAAKTYIRTQKVTRWVDEVIIHHTWSPTATDYRGESTVAAVRRFHMGGRGWRDNGYHFMVAPNADLWRCRPLAEAGAHTANRNSRSVGVSYIANFDAQQPRSHGGYGIGQQLVLLLLERFNLDVRNIRFHTEFAAKSCPGKLMVLDRYRMEVASLKHAYAPQGRLVRVFTDPFKTADELDVDARLVNGVTQADLRALARALEVEPPAMRYGPLRPFAEAAGWDVHARIVDHGKIYLRRKPQTGGT